MLSPIPGRRETVWLNQDVFEIYLPLVLRGY